jgi:MFS family permease
VFLWAALPGLVTVALACAIREPQPDTPAPPPAAAASAVPRRGAGFDWRLGDMPPVLRRYLLVVALFTLGNSSNMFLLLRARELGLAAPRIPLLWATVSVVAMLCSTPLSALGDRLGHRRVLVGGYLAYAAFYATLGLLRHAGPGLWLLFALYGLFIAATEGVEKALVAELAPPDRRGTAFGWFNLTAGICLLPASLVFGWFYQVWAPWVAFAFASGCALLAAGLLLRWVGLRDARSFSDK